MNNNAFLLRPLALAAGLACASAAHAQALPHNPTVINGTAVVNAFSNSLQVVNSPGTIIHWDSFSIGNGRTVRFDQVSAQSAVLNRVTGGSYSEILGTLQSNGRVFLLNPNGIVFGAGSVVDTAGLLASTLDISNEDFLAGNYRFRCFNATVCESGVDVLNPYTNRIVLKDGSRITTRTAGEGSQVWLIARERITSEKGSSIDAPTGQVMAAAAREVTITSPALGRMSFTLAGTAGSRIDLEGDIDAARGAAGFFADTIRLAGGVRARSDVDAAGQIVANAGSQVLVEGDARLDVSGTAGADAGAIRLSATQRVRVAASAEIAADGGRSPDGNASGGQGGLIDLKAAEVVLPGLLGPSYFEAPIQLHAFGYGPAGRVLARDGRVEVEETGTFAHEVVLGPQWIGSEAAIERSAGSYVYTVNGNLTSIETIMPSGDGRFLLITRRNERSDLTTSSSSSYAASASTTTVYEMHVVNADGSVASTRVLASDTDTRSDNGTPYPTPRSFRTYGLTKGGWMIATDAHYLFVRPDTLSVVEVPKGDNSVVQVLQGGGILMQVYGSETPSYSVYDSLGRLQPDTAAALANEPLTTTALYRPHFSVNFDTRREWVSNRSTYRLEYVDSVTGEVLRQSPVDLQAPSVAAQVNGTVLLNLYEGIAAVHGDDYTLLRTNTYSDTYTSDFVQGVAGTISSESIQITHGNWTPASSANIGFVSSDSTLVNSQSFRNDPYFNNTDRTQDLKVSFNQYVRRLESTPAASTGAGADLLASPLLASRPGASNGVAAEGPYVPPVVNPPAPGPSGGPAASGELPPPAYFVPTRAPGGFEVAKSPMTVSADAVTDRRSQAEIDAEILAEAERLVGEYMGPQDAARFAAAKTSEERRPFMNEVAYAMAVGEEVYDATRRLGPDMRGAVFNGWGTAQAWGLEDDEDFSTGLMRAMTEKLPAAPNEDGSPGVPRTRLEAALDVMELELRQATTEQEKKRIGLRVFREMVHAAREASGQEVDPDADLVLSDGNGGTVRITEDGEQIRS